jgi:hypothetical protein
MCSRETMFRSFIGLGENWRRGAWGNLAGIFTGSGQITDSFRANRMSISNTYVCSLP